MLQNLAGQTPIYNKLHLLHMSQQATLVGSYELDLSTQQFLCTDALFMVLALPLTPGNLISFQDVLNIVVPEERDAFTRYLFEDTSTRILEFNCTIQHGNMPRKYLHAWFQNTVNEDGTPVKRGSFQDVTKQRHYQQQLEHNNEKLQIQAEINRHVEVISNSGSFEWNTITGELKCSDNFYRIFGMEPQSQPASIEMFLQLIHPGDVANVNAMLHHIAAEGEISENEFRMYCIKGELHYLNSRSTTIRNRDNQFITVATVRDVTKEKKILHTLQQRSIVAELISDNNVDMIAAFDSNLRFIGWNRKCEERYQRTKDQVLGKTYIEILPFIVGTELEQALHSALEGKTTQTKEKMYADNSGYFESFILPLQNDGTIYGVLVISHDLTEIKHAAEQLTLLNRQLEQKNAELTKTNGELASFTYIASHDLQEPLRKIRTFSERLLEREMNNLSDTGKDYLSRMDGASKRMQQLIDDLLAFSRTSTAPKEFTVVDLNTMLSEVQENIRLLIDETGAKITADKLPSANVVPFQFKQLLENLLINSMKYRKESVTPVINITYQQASGDELPFVPSELFQQYHKISITDNGIGFEQQYAEKIFEIFQRLHGKHEYSGTGVGLAIVKKTMENHHGFIDAQGRPGEGATFNVYLPV
jgi:two-component system, chemotaxis family, CheB/CheR fusion protein